METYVVSTSCRAIALRRTSEWNQLCTNRVKACVIYISRTRAWWCSAYGKEQQLEEEENASLHLYCPKANVASENALADYHLSRLLRKRREPQPQVQNAPEAPQLQWEASAHAPIYYSSPHPIEVQSCSYPASLPGPGFDELDKVQPNRAERVKTFMGGVHSGAKPLSMAIKK